jgi:glyoxylase I family protein
MRSRGIHHLDLVVSDVERSKHFYSELLRGLGWSGVLELEGERGETIWYLQAHDTWIGLREKQSDAHSVPYDRYAVGVHHVAFEASSREAVDRCWIWVLEQDAAFFYDPDGIKLEVVYEPTRAAITST